MNDPFLIRPVSPYSLGKVQLIHDPGLDQHLPDHLQNHAREQWNRLNEGRHSKGKPPLQDLPLFRPGVIQLHGDQIQIPCGITSYRAATVFSGPCAHWEEPYTGAGLSIVPVCADNQILIGRRSGVVHQGQSLFHVAAGHAHPKASFQTQSDTLTEAVLQELTEEMAIQSSDIENMEFLGIGLNRSTSKTEFLTRVWLKENADLYIKQWEKTFTAQKEREFDEITTVESIIGNDSFESYRDQFTIACRMALKVHW